MKLILPSFIGKATGALIGFLLIGWVGFALGIILGHGLDYHRPSLAALLNRLPRGRLPQSGESIYREALFLCLGHLAKQDGRVSPQEIAAAEALFKRMKLKPRERQQAIELFNRGKLPGTLMEPYLEQFRRRYATRKQKRLVFLEQLLAIAYADGGPQAAQLARLQDFLQVLEISQPEFERLHRRLRQTKDQESEQQKKRSNHYTRKPSPEITLVNAYRTLGLNSTASNREIKLTYRRLMSQHHPDKLAAQGLTDRALEKAKERTQEVQQAYAVLKKAREI